MRCSFQQDENGSGGDESAAYRSLLMVGDSWPACQLSLAEGIRKATSDVIITPDNASYEG
jgi:hypothetical protein